ncbi:MAG: FkbM family methyltransferase [Candidatus Paceibacteria bacterium]|jgi:FkbM family methyltransferase
MKNKNRLHKKILKSFFKLFNKRLVDINAPAKPYKEGVAFLKKIIDAPNYIIDIGYADGTPDLTASFPMSTFKYLLIDANPNFYAALNKAKQNYPNVSTEKCFCGEGEATVSLNLSKQGYESSMYRDFEAGETVQVKTRTLDNIVEQHNISGPLLIKIDVEGSEIDVLKGASDTLKMADVVILETWINVPDSDSPGDFAKIVEIMDDNNFVVFDFFGGYSHKSGVLAHIDTVFVKRDSKYRKIII